MPKHERVLLLLLGYVVNQVSMLQKLLTFATNQTPEDELGQHVTGAQTQMLFRLTVGAVREAWRVIETRFLQTPLAKEYAGLLDEPGRQALDALKQQFGRSNAISSVRSNYAFHLPESDDVEEAFELASADGDLDDCWNLYFSHHGFNTLFFASDLIFIHGIARQLGEAKPENAHRRLMSEVSISGGNLLDFAKAFVAAAWKKHFGSEILAKDMVPIADAPYVDDVLLPFFVRVQ
jgi:hypothetical protein